MKIKTKKFLIPLWALISIVLSGCASSKVTSALNKVNKNSNFDFKIGTKISAIDWEEYSGFMEVAPPTNCMGCNHSYVSLDGKTRYGTNGVPDISNPLAISSFSTSDEKYYIYDFKIGSSTNELATFFTKLGYEYLSISLDIEGSVPTHNLRISSGGEEETNDDVILFLWFVGNETISKMGVSFSSSNKKGIVY